jgi:hypothetical protein
MKAFASAAAGAVLLFAAGAAQGAVLYSEDFNDGVADGFAGFTAVETAPSAEKFLGVLDLNDTGTVAVNTAGYNNLVLTFDLYAIRSVDGTGASCCGPDAFRVIVNGVTVFDESFANNTSWAQSYGPNATDPGRTGSDAALYGNLGYGDHFGTNSVYHITLNLGSGVTSIGFQGGTEQAWTDEGFGLDNVVLSGHLVGGGGAIPEPATWALMIAGFGGAGAMLRRRRTAVA